MTKQELNPLIPDGWQPDFMTDMRKIADQIACGHAYPGYPRLFDRLYIPEEDIQYTPDGRPILPYDPYSTYTLHDHPGHNDLTKTRPPEAFYDMGQSLTSEEGARLQWVEGGGLDNRNFPLHPFWKHMLTDEDIGGIVSQGYYWKLGPNTTADLAALTLQETDAGLALHALTVIRSDTGQHAFPGGHTDKDEASLTAALRETLEETGVDLHHLTPEHVWDGPVADHRITLHAGPRTTLALVDVKDQPDTTPKGLDDAAHAEWRIMNREWIEGAFGSHPPLACSQYDTGRSAMTC